MCRVFGRGSDGFFRVVIGGDPCATSGEHEQDVGLANPAPEDSIGGLQGRVRSGFLWEASVFDSMDIRHSRRFVGPSDVDAMTGSVFLLRANAGSAVFDQLLVGRLGPADSVGTRRLSRCGSNQPEGRGS